MQTAIGLTLRQGIERFIVIGGSVALGTSLCLVLVKHPLLINALAAISFSMGCYFSIKHSLNYFALSIPFLAGLMILLAMLLPAADFHFLYSRLYDISLGAVIGIVVNLLVFPSRVDVEFRDNVILILRAYCEYLTAIDDLLYKKPGAEENVNNKKFQVEHVLQSQSAFFPVWVYETGFTVSMRIGHRHFLVMIERIGQILFSMNFIARQQIDMNLLRTLQEPLNKCLEQAKQVLCALTVVLNLEKLTEGVSDLSGEISELEEAFNKAVPLTDELMDISPEYIYLASLIQDIKDLQVVLIRLGVALRPE